MLATPALRRTWAETGRSARNAAHRTRTVVSAAVTLSATSTITFECDDFGSMANAHSVVLTAIG
jgi:hypothetical protein